MAYIHQKQPNRQKITLGYHQSAVRGWQNSNKSALDIINEYQKKIQNKEWLSTEDRQRYKTAIDDYTSSGNALRDVSKHYGQKYTADEEKSWTDSIASLQTGYSSVNDFYSQFGDETTYGYFSKRFADDYADNSKYVSTKYGDPHLNIFSGTYDDTGFGDIEYDYINKNTDASNIKLTNDTVYGSTFAGTDKSERFQMTDDEIGIFNYIYKTEGKDAAYAFVDYLESDLNARQRQATQEAWAKYANESPFEASVFSVLTSPLKGVSYIGQATDFISDGKIDQNAGYNKHSYINSAIRNQVSQQIEASGKWGQVGSFAYQTGMSMGDFLFNTAITGGNQALSLALMGTSAAADTTISAKDRGLEDWQAFTLGTVAGAAEIVMEKIGLDALFDTALLGKNALGYVIKNALSEGGEEVGSSIINLLTDTIVSGEKSQWKTAINGYMSNGADEKTAFWRAVGDQALSLGADFLGGAISGGVMGGAGAGIHSAGVTIQGSNIKSAYGSNTGNLAYEALSYDPSNSFAQKMQSKVAKGGELSNYQVGKLAGHIQSGIIEQDSAKIKSAVEARLSELGETGDVSAIADVIARQTAGEDISFKDKSIIKGSKFAERVANELNRDNIQSGQYSSAWAEGIGTKRVNADVYNRRESSNTKPQNVTGETTPHPSSNDARLAEARSQNGSDVINVIHSRSAATLPSPSEQRGRQELLAESAKLIEQAAKDKVGRIEGFTDETASVMVKDYDGSVPASDYVMAFDQAFRLGRDDAQVRELTRLSADTGVTGRALLHAYDAGLQSRNVASKATTNNFQNGNSSVNPENTVLQNTAEGGIINTESESITNEGKTGTEGVYLRQGSERLAGANPEGQVSRVEGGAGQNQEWREGRGRPADREAARLIDEGRGREVRVADLGILNGSKQQKVRVIDEQDYTPEIKEAVAEAEAQGLNAKVFVGDDILIEEKNGSISGVHAYVLGNQMLIRADHEHFTSKQFARHEIGHDKIAKGQVDIKAVRKRLEEKVGKEAIDSVAQTYAEAYGRTGLDADEVWEECICDSLGDMNIFAGDEIISDFMAPMIAEIKAVTESETKAPTQTRGSPEGKASREITENNTDYEEESEVYETRKETRDEFNRAAHAEGYTVGERGQIAYAYKVCRSVTENAQKTKEELRKLGIKGIIHEGLKSNYNGTTTTYDAGASTFAGVCVFVDNQTGRDAVETAGHEAFHYWQASSQRGLYREIIDDNIIFSSKEFSNFQSEIAKDYFGEEIPLDDKRWPLLAEEIPAYITGYIYSGDVDNIVRPFLRDYDEVKTAMDSFFASQQNKDIRYSRELDLIDYINEQAEREAVTKGEVRGHIASEKDLSNRELLVSALESITSYPSERGILTDYRAMLETIGKAERRIADIDSDIKVLSKDKKNAEYVKLLKKEKASLTEEIHLADKRLLKLESAKALKKVMEREKARVAEQGKKDLARLRERSETRLAETKKQYQESRARATEGRHKTAEIHKIQRVAKELDKLLNRGTKERNVKNGEIGIVRAALDLSNMLFVSDDELLFNGFGTRVTTAEAQAMDAYVELYEEYHSYDNAVTENKTRRAELRSQMNDLKSEFSDALERERNRISEAKAVEAYDALIREYESLAKAEEDYLKKAYRPEVAEYLKTFREEIGKTLVTEMSLEQLERLYKGFTMIKHMVSESNKLFRDGKRESYADRVETIYSNIDSLKKLFGGDYPEKIGKLLDKLNEFGWNNLRPVDAFELAGSEAFSDLFWDNVKAQGVYGRDISEVAVSLIKAREKYGYNRWKIEETKDFKTDDGRTFTVTLGEMMSIYAYSKRDQADGHMREGGFQHEKDTTYKDKNGIRRKRAKEAQTYRVGDKMKLDIISSLTKEQKAYVDEMQALLTKWGEKGNEASRILYGIDLFTESVYFPLVSSKDYLSSVSTEIGQTVTTASLAGSGMTKATVPGADNPIILRAFDDVILEHFDKMSKYHAYVVPIDNIRKVFDGQIKTENGDMLSIKALIGSHFGKGASEYFQNYITDLNGSASISGASNPLESFFSKSKGASVAANISVWIQQYFSIIRALGEVNPRYFLPFMGESFKKPDMKLYDEMKKYAPVTVIKEMGGFDVGSNRGINDYLGYEGARMTTKKAWKKFQDALGVGAQAMDKLGWMTIWKGVKKEVAATGKYKTGSGEYFKACGERFEQIITKTQVYDSVNAKSGYMRSKNPAVKYLVSFMGEPTTIAGMAEVSIIRFGRAVVSKDETKIKEAGAKLASNLAAIVVSTAMTSVAKSLVYAMRDDDEDETYLEKYAEALGKAFRDDINLLNYFPIARDIASIIEGYDVERPDMTLVADLINNFRKAYDALLDEDAEDDEKLQKYINAGLSLANILGIPAKTIYRDINGLVNTLNNIGNNYRTDFGDKFTEGWKGEELTKGEKLYQSIVSGDSKLVDYYKSTYKDESTYLSAVRKALRDNDPRLEEAALARLEGDTDTYWDLFLDVVEEGKFKDELIKAAFEAEYNYHKNKAKEAKARGETYP